jgi:hypothetical protein
VSLTVIGFKAAVYGITNIQGTCRRVNAGRAEVLPAKQ